MTLVRICPALRPRSGRCARPLRHLGTAPATVTTKAPTITSLSRLNHTASTVAAYASRLGRPARARLASGCWPTLPGGIGYPQGHYRRFPSVTSLLPPSPGLSWRDAVRYVRGFYLMLPPDPSLSDGLLALLVSPFRPVTAGSFTSGGHTPEDRS
jgi:hypothetical protein